MTYKHVTTLKKRIDAAKEGLPNSELTDVEKLELFKLVRYGRRQKTRDALESKIYNCPLSCWQNFNRYDRVHFDEINGERIITYCAGQSYPDEITELKELILGNL